MNRLRIGVACISIGSVMFFGFQNCSQPGTIALSEKIDNSSFAIPIDNKVLDVDLSKSSPPPLKLFIITDNSESMRLSQLNLKQSITAMFDGQSKNISEFDTEIFLINTAQLSALVPTSFMDTMLTAETVAATKSMNDITTKYRTPTDVNGQIAGDTLGFRRSLVTSPGRSSYVFLPTPVSQFVLDSNNELNNFPSIKFSKGDSIDKITQGISDRLDTLDPNRAQKNYSLFPVLDSESGLCAIARVLNNNQGFINPGDLASFLVVSDENDAGDASKCIQSLNSDSYYNVDCTKPIPATSTSYTSIKYDIPAGASSVATSLSVTPKNLTVPRRNTTLLASVNSSPAVCNGTYQSKFKVWYKISNPQFKVDFDYTQAGTYQSAPAVPAVCTGRYQKDFGLVYNRVIPRYEINYKEEVYITTRPDSGVAIYQPPVDKKSSIQLGSIPNGCDTEAFLRTKVSIPSGPTGSRLSSIVCSAVTNLDQLNLTDKMTFATVTSAASATTSSATTSSAAAFVGNETQRDCTDDVKMVLLMNQPVGSQIPNCTMSKSLTAIPAQSITGFDTKFGTEANCTASVANACSGPMSAAFRECEVTQYTAYQAAQYLPYNPTPQSRTISGAVPNPCDAAYVRSYLGDTTSSTIAVTSCVQSATNFIPTSESNKLFDFKDYPNVDISNLSVCPDNVKAKLVEGLTIPNSVVHSCRLEKQLVTIPNGFPAATSSVDCQNRISQYCVDSAGTKFNCAITGSYTAGIVAKQAGPITVTNDTDLSCTALCSTFAGLCDANAGAQTVQAWAQSQGMACSKTNANHPTETYSQPQTARTVSKTTSAQLSCSNTCAEFPAACGGNSNSSTIESYNQTCVFSSKRDIAGTPAVLNKLLGTVEDKNSLMTCNTTCADSSNLCGADKSSRTIAQYISGLNPAGENCVATASPSSTPAGTDRKKQVDVLEKDIAGICPVGYTLDMASKVVSAKAPLKTTDYVTGNNGAAPAATLEDYIKQRLSDLVGSERSSLSVFITRKSEETAGITSWGEAYEKLANAIGGSTNNIKADSYAPALINLSSILRDQLQRSLTVSEVKSNAKITKVWRKSKSVSDWGQPLAANLWSASGNTITFNQSLVLNYDDEIRIEYHY